MQLLLILIIHVSERLLMYFNVKIVTHNYNAVITTTRIHLIYRIKHNKDKYEIEKKVKMYKLILTITTVIKSVQQILMNMS